MKLKEHQEDAVKQGSQILNKYNLLYIFGMPRIGKSLIALELFKNKYALVITKKGAINDWLKYKEFYNFDICNYEAIKKYNSQNYNAIILDEAHNLGKIPKPSLRTKNIKTFCQNKPIIFLSGTPLAETALSIYPQLSISSFSPFKGFRNFYDFFKKWGISEKIYFYGHLAETYKKYKPELLDFIEPYIIKLNYKQAKINYNNKDKIIKIKANNAYYELLNNAKKGFIKPNIYFENNPAINMALHQIEGGTLKDRILINKPKFNWILQFVNNNKNAKIAIMAYFIAEQEFLRQELPNNCIIYSSTKYCEGIDLSAFDIYILYSFGYSGAKFIQLRDRIFNINISKEREVIIPLIEKSIGENIYKAVSSKKNFNLKIIGA